VPYFEPIITELATVRVSGDKQRFAVVLRNEGFNLSGEGERDFVVVRGPCLPRGVRCDEVRWSRRGVK
jgi:hypothetical protein